jgi:hypothetical protein
MTNDTLPPLCFLVARRRKIIAPNDVWAMDFMSDAPFDGRPCRLLTVILAKGSQRSESHLQSLSMWSRSSTVSWQRWQAKDHTSR